MFVNMADLRVGFLCRHEVIRDVDIEQEVIHELVTAWRESNTVLLPILVKIDSASSVKRILVCNFLQDHGAFVGSTKNGTASKKTQSLQKLDTCIFHEMFTARS